MVVPGHGSFDHRGLLYRDPGEYLSGATAFVHSALEAGDPVLVAVPDPGLDLLRGALAEAAGEVSFADMSVVGRNPGRIIPGVLLAFAAAHPGRRAWIVGEPIWPGRTELEYPACAAHEALVNAVFAGRDAAILCPYDVTGLPATAVRDAWRTHPVMLDGGARRPSGAYADPLATAAGFNLPLPPVPPGAASMEYDGGLLLAAVRRFVLGHAAGVLGADRAHDLVLAANELTANTVEHAGGGGRIAVWTEPGRLVCQIDDGGRLLDPLAGRIVPLPRTEGGRGLVLANELCDLVRVHTTPAGTSIRLHMAS
ncbi:anti-sigma factor RsbA family regulatory protein [Actinoplanes sp. NPDC049668]|uniref:anti-sigma factor RsbA family regulatory protein n=1 Tax=unclassified Actinoplanes TaxID=2626549 RepID=UPI0033BF6EE3